MTRRTRETRPRASLEAPASEFDREAGATPRSSGTTPKGGAPKGNANARRHGIYALADDVLAPLVAEARKVPPCDLSGELALSRARLAHAMGAGADQQASGAEAVDRLIDVIRRLVASQAQAAEASARTKLLVFDLAERKAKQGGSEGPVIVMPPWAGDAETVRAEDGKQCARVVIDGVNYIRPDAASPWRRAVASTGPDGIETYQLEEPRP